jgi:putative phage-type endonuclease
MANAAYDSPDVVKAWLADRRTRLQASEVAAAIGLSPWRTALDVYLDKTAEPDDYRLPDEPTDEMRWGLLYEPVIARAYELATNETLRDPGLVVHPRHCWLGATPDRVNEAGRPVELKKVRWNRADGWGEPGTDHIPEWYLIQVHIQISALDADAGRLAALVGEDDLRRYAIERNERAEKLVIDLAWDFWRRVERRDPPAPDWSHPATAELLSRLHRPRPGTLALLEAEAVEAIAAYHHLGEAIGRLEKTRKEAKARVISAMGTAETGVAPGWKITRKEIARAGYTVKPCTYIDLRVKPTESTNEHGNAIAPSTNGALDYHQLPAAG